MVSCVTEQLQREILPTRFSGAAINPLDVSMAGDFLIRTPGVVVETAVTQPPRKDARLRQASLQRETTL